MCMLFVKPKEFELPRNYFNSLKVKNPDGIAFYNASNQSVYKTMDYEDGWKYLTENKDSEIVVHFRFGTSGQDTTDQLHGFPVCDDNYLLFHNGVLNTFKGDIKTGLSDTQQLAHVFSDQPIERLVKYLEEFERGSRFLIVDKVKNEFIIPSCAKWNGDATIEGVKIQFSNSYAIDYRLLDNDFSWKGYGNYGYTSWGDEDYSNTNTQSKNTTSSKFDKTRMYADLFKGAESGKTEDELELEDEELTCDLIELMWKGNKSNAVDFIKLYPDIAHGLLVDLMTKENLDLPF